MNFYLTLSIILVAGALINQVLQKFRLPALIGYMLIGIAIASYMPRELADVSSQIRKIALIIILLKAGLSLDFSDIKKVGKPAILLSILPCCCEMIGIGIFAHYILDLPFLTSLLLGSVLGAVSPAIVVPRMSRLLDEKVGTKQGIPQMITAGSSMDDIVMLVFYSSFLTLVSGGKATLYGFLKIPEAVLTGVTVGLLLGIGLSFVFKKVHMRDSLKVIYLLGIGFFLVYAEGIVDGKIGFSSLLAIITIGVVLYTLNPIQAKRVKEKFDRLWVVAEIFLFVFVGASIRMEYAIKLLGPALLTICLALAVRAIGVKLALTHTDLTNKEKWFVCISYLPKATVQAAIGSGLLDLATTLNDQTLIHQGTIVLSTAVVAILFTAPLGATLMDTTYKKLLDNR